MWATLALLRWCTVSVWEASWETSDVVLLALTTREIDRMKLSSQVVRVVLWYCLFSRPPCAMLWPNIYELPSLRVTDASRKSEALVHGFPLAVFTDAPST